ncbi:MAG: GAF domain-containing protein [Anaerolineales bacterium]|nr:GAF domain-containing protein [Anaerolineales bacterium]
MKLNEAIQQDVGVLGRVGRSLTSVLDLDKVLKRIVEAAVKLTGAEEGSVLLVDKATGELYMRAAQNFDDEFVRTFSLPVQDSLAGKVLRNGKPILINQDRTQKIKTAYLVRSLIYVPLIVSNQVIGVLGVDNREQDQIFSENHVVWVSTLADYAAIAIENASLYSHTVAEQTKLETVLDNIEDGVIVINHELQIEYVNKIAEFAFGLAGKNLTGEHFRSVFKHPDLLELVGEDDNRGTRRGEIEFEDGRVFNARLTPITDVGYAISIQDISYLKELDRIKSDYVKAVSHDLRSPLTAILGYVELIERAGEINDQQREFIERVQTSVLNITDMISDLLDLGRIESGLDVNKEII